MFISTIHSIHSIGKLKENGIDAILLGVQGLSIRSLQYLSLDEVKLWKQECDKNNVKLYINAMRFFMEEDLKTLQESLQFFKELQVDGIYFADEGVLREAMKINFEDVLVYQPETLIVNHFDVQFYLNQGIQAVSLAHELSLNEIQKIASKQVEILIHGYYSILYSKRPLIQNYFDAVQIDESYESKRFDLIEQTRDDRMPIYQDKTGTHIFSEVPISSFDEFETLKNSGIERFRIDSIFFDDEWTCKVVQAYKNNQSFDSGSNHWYHQQSITKKGENE